MAISTRGKQVLATVAILGVVAAGTFSLQRPNAEPLALEVPTPAPTLVATQTLIPTPPAPLVVFVSGEVVSPDVYTLPPNSRVVDAIAAAGGLTDKADPNALNQATLLKDEMQIYVPPLGAEPTPLPISDGANEATTRDGKVNINTASVDDLETLTGIGPTKAEAIIAYREEHGVFTSIDQLLDVPGIGDVTLDGMRDEITLE